MAAHVVFDRNFFQVVKKFLALREIPRPPVSRAERVGIGVIRRVHAAAGIPIDVPGAAQFRILLDDGVGDAQPAECHSQGYRAYAGADDEHVVVLQRRMRGMLAPPHIARDKAHFLAHHRRVFRRDVLAETGPHHFQHQFVAGIGDRRFGLAVFEQFEDRGTDFVLDLLGHPGFWIRDQADITLRLVRRLKPTPIAGHVNQHHQQNANISLGDCR